MKQRPTWEWEILAVEVLLFIIVVLPYIDTNTRATAIGALAALATAHIVSTAIKPERKNN